jgi:hypothetical protein
MWTGQQGRMSCLLCSDVLAMLASLTYLRPSPIPLLNNLRNRPALRIGFAAENILDDHGGRESRGDVEDFEVTVITQDLSVHEFPTCYQEDT